MKITRTIEDYYDDLAGDQETLADETGIQLGFDGVAVELDLSQGNAKELREFLKPYMAAGQKVQFRNGPPRQRKSAGYLSQHQRRRREIIDWGKTQPDWRTEALRLEASSARTPSKMIAAYEKAHGQFPAGTSA